MPRLYKLNVDKREFMSESILVIEEKRSEIQRILAMPLSCYKKLSLLSNFFSLLLSANNKNILQAYCTGLIAPYSNYLASCDISCMPPAKHSHIIATAETFLASEAFPDTADTLEQSLTSFKGKVEELVDTLGGKDTITPERNNYLFPLVDTTNGDGEMYGMLDSVTVKITKGKQQIFHIIPSEKEIETRINTQVETSWNVAVAYARKYIKHISPHHEVIVSFDKRVGFYVGDSLGVALTLAYINELFLYYNTPLTITAKEGSCFTGSILLNGEIPSIDAENITKKVELVFYSCVKTFVLPKEDETAAEEKLRELKKEYPNRNLKLIAIADIEDMLSRRNVVDIKKLSILKRTGKTIVRNKLVTALLITLIAILSLVYFYEYDDNPYGYDATQGGFNIVNQSGRVLWTIKKRLPDKVINTDLRVLETIVRVLDLNNDKKNEVIFCFEANDAIADKSISNGVAFFDYKGKIFNKIVFTKNVNSKREILAPTYTWSLRDTLTYNGRKSLLMIVGNFISYASAAFIVELKTQKIISDTLWNCGHFIEIKAVDLDGDGRKEIIGTAYNNGRKRLSLFCVKLSKLKGQIPSIDEYKLYNIGQADLMSLFLLPKTDCVAYYNQGMAGFEAGGMSFSQNTVVRIKTIESIIDYGGGVIYDWNSKTNEFSIAISGHFALFRDSLVAQGKLKKPFTDTWEYRKLIHDQILQWNGKDFVPIKK